MIQAGKWQGLVKVLGLAFGACVVLGTAVRAQANTWMLVNGGEFVDSGEVLDSFDTTANREHVIFDIAFNRRGDVVYTFGSNSHTTTGLLAGRFDPVAKRWEIWNGTTWTNASSDGHPASILPSFVSSIEGRAHTKLVPVSEPGGDEDLIGIVTSVGRRFGVVKEDVHDYVSGIRFSQGQWTSWIDSAPAPVGTTYELSNTRALLNSWQFNVSDFDFDPDRGVGIAATLAGFSDTQGFRPHLTALRFTPNEPSHWSIWNTNRFNGEPPVGLWTDENAAPAGADLCAPPGSPFEECLAVANILNPSIIDPHIDDQGPDNALKDVLRLHAAPNVTYIGETTSEFLCSFQYPVTDPGSPNGIMNLGLCRYDDANTRWQYWDGVTWVDAIDDPDPDFDFGSAIDDLFANLGGPGARSERFPERRQTYWYKDDTANPPEHLVSILVLKDGIQEIIYNHADGSVSQPSQVVGAADLTRNRFVVAKNAAETLALVYSTQNGAMHQLSMRTKTQGATSWSAPICIVESTSALLPAGLTYFSAPAGGGGTQEIPLLFFLQEQGTDEFRMKAASPSDPYWNGEVTRTPVAPPASEALNDLLLSASDKAPNQVSRDLVEDDDGYVYHATEFSVNVYPPDGIRVLWGSRIGGFIAQEQGGIAIDTERNKIYTTTQISRQGFNETSSGRVSRWDGDAIIGFGADAKPLRESAVPDPKEDSNFEYIPFQFFNTNDFTLTPIFPRPNDLAVDEESDLLYVGSISGEITVFDLDDVIHFHDLTFERADVFTTDITSCLTEVDAVIDNVMLAAANEYLVVDGVDPSLLHWNETALEGVIIPTIKDSLEFQDLLACDVNVATRFLKNVRSHHHLYNNRPRRLHAFGSLGTGTAQFNDPKGIDTSDDGKVFIADTDNHRIQVWQRQIDGQGVVSHVHHATYGTHGYAGGEFHYPHDVAFDPVSGHLYIIEPVLERIQAIDADTGAFLFAWSSWGGPFAGEFDSSLADAISGIHTNRFGQLLVSNGDELVRFQFVNDLPSLSVSAPAECDEVIGSPLTVSGVVQDDLGVFDINVRVFSESNIVGSGAATFEGMDTTVPTNFSLNVPISGFTPQAHGLLEIVTRDNSGQKITQYVAVALGGHGTGADTDGDCDIDACDNCPAIQNATQSDCNHDGIGDVCAIADGLQSDCNQNGIPDDCESIADMPDCDENGVWDVCDITNGLIQDCNGDLIPDECQLFASSMFLNSSIAIQPPDGLNFFSTGGLRSIDADCQSGPPMTSWTSPPGATEEDIQLLITLSSAMQVDSLDVVQNVGDLAVKKISLIENFVTTVTVWEAGNPAYRDPVPNVLGLTCAYRFSWDRVPFTTETIEVILANDAASLPWEFDTFRANTADISVDCDFNLQVDACEIAADPSLDCDADGTLDVCQTGPLPPCRILHVDDDATGTGNGSDWANAFTSLQDALAEADAVPAISGRVLEMRVAAGTYYPDVGAGLTLGDRTVSFVARDGLTLLGGFAGADNPGNPDLRDVRRHATILSGDIGTVGDATDNSYHVILGSGVSASAVFDGVTIRDGNSDLAALPVGAGVRIEAGSPTFHHCTFMDNRNVPDVPFGRGGAVYLDGGAPSFSRCRFLGNEAEGGGAMWTQSGSPSFSNCEFSGNTASGSGAFAVGGAFAIITGELAMTNCTVANNTATTFGGGVFIFEAARLNNNIFWDNTANFASTVENEQLFVINTELVVINHSCVEGWTGDLCGIGNIGTDPLFRDSDGPDCVLGTLDDDLRLSPGSPAVGTGDNGHASMLTADLDGGARIHPPGQTVDMGAIELTAVYLDLGAAGDDSGTSWVNAAFTPLRALELADEIEGPVDIFVAQGVYLDWGQEPVILDLFKQTFLLTNDLSVWGGYQGSSGADPNLRDVDGFPTVLSGGDFRFHVVTATGVDASAVVDGLTITAGRNSIGSGENPPRGAGVDIVNASPVFRNCRIVGNIVDNITAWGGGIYVEGGSPRFIHCEITGNQASAGGGLWLQSGTVTADNCLFRNNLAINGVLGTGGAIASGLDGTLNLTNCTVVSNEAMNPAGGGGIYLGASQTTTTLQNCIVWGNLADGFSADVDAQVWASAGSITVLHSCIEDDDAFDAIIPFDPMLLNGNLDDDPSFVDPDGVDNIPNTDDENYRLNVGSPCIDQGDDSAVPDDVKTDLDGNPRFVVTVDMGGYENQ